MYYTLHCAQYANLNTHHEKDSTNKFVRNFQQIMQNEPNFHHFSPKNNDSTKKRTQTNPILAKNLPLRGRWFIMRIKPIRTQNSKFKILNSKFDVLGSDGKTLILDQNQDIIW
jgi:hypothetical protein